MYTNDKSKQDYYLTPAKNIMWLKHTTFTVTAIVNYNERLYHISNSSEMFLISESDVFSFYSLVRADNNTYGGNLRVHILLTVHFEILSRYC